MPPFSLCNPSLVCLCSPHPVKPLSAAPVEGSPDRKQSRSSLSIALSSGLEKLKTVTSGSIQPVTQAPQAGQMVDTKKLKVRPSKVWGSSDRMCGGVSGLDPGEGGAESRPGPPCQSPEAS